MTQKQPVAVLAATGAVGQRFVSLLEDHPWFEVTVVTGSERTVGRRYGEAVNWVVPGEIPATVRDSIVQPTTPEALRGVKLVFSALPTAIAREVEPVLAAAGYAVCSNASAYRMEEDVPLLIPEINPEHVRLIDVQRERRGWDGLIVTCPNCATTSIIFPMKALQDAFGLRQVHTVTMQAISGAGYPGVSSFDILDNIVPYIGGEEEKIETELRKLLGTLTNGHVTPAEVVVSAQVHRVPVMDGHLGALSAGLIKHADIDTVKEALRHWHPPEEVAGLPSAPPQALILRDEPDRPQPRRDRDAGRGMAVTVGRVQPCPVFDVKLVSLAHNTIRGAAGGAILNAEWLVAEGYI